MQIFAYSAVIIMAIRCISYGIYELRERNFMGAAAVWAVSVASVIAGLKLFH